MGHIAIVGHLERLWPHGKNHETPTFGLNLSASLVRDSQGLVDQLDQTWVALLIWFWDQVRIRVRVHRGVDVWDAQPGFQITPIAHGQRDTDLWAPWLRCALLRAAKARSRLVAASDWDSFVSDPEKGQRRLTRHD